MKSESAEEPSPLSTGLIEYYRQALRVHTNDADRDVCPICQSAAAGTSCRPGNGWYALGRTRTPTPGRTNKRMTAGMSAGST